MKNFIKDKLRLILESRLDEGVKYSTNTDLERFRYTAVKYKSLYGDDRYFNSVDSGDAILRVSVDYRGIVADISTPKVSADIAKSNIGLVSVTPNYLVFHIMAGRGIEHPGTVSPSDEVAVTRKSGKVEYDYFTGVSPDGELVKYKVAKPGSPASDAMVKVYINFPNDIEFHIKKNMKGFDAYSADDSGAEIAAAKNDPEMAANIAKKMELLKRQEKSNIESSDELKSLQSEKNVLNSKLGELRRLGGKEARVEIRDIRRQIKAIDAKIKDISADWDAFKKSKDKSIGV